MADKLAMTGVDAAWEVGLVFEGASSLMGTIGKQLLRYAATTSNPWYYPVGFTFSCVLGPAFDVAGYSFAAASIITACSGLVVGWNVLLAPWTLGEPLTSARQRSAAIIFAGTVLTGVFGNHQEVERTVEQYLALFARPAALAYFATLLAVLGFCLWRAHVLSRPGTPEGARSSGMYVSALAGLMAGNTFTTKAVIQMVVCVSGDAVQSVGCQSNPFVTPWPYLLTCCAVMTSAGSLLILAVALRSCEALSAITVFEGSMIVSGAFAGNIVLDEVSGQSAGSLVGYALSIGVIVLGFAVLFRGEFPPEEDDADKAADEHPYFRIETLEPSAAPAMHVARIFTPFLNTLNSVSRSGTRTSPASGVTATLCAAPQEGRTGPGAEV